MEGESMESNELKDAAHEPLAVEDEEAEAKDGELPVEDATEVGPKAPHFLKLPEPDPERKPPAWFPRAMIPSMKFPRGIEVAFVRIRGKSTAAKHKGDRYLICWELSDGDEKLAYGRSMNDPNRASGELTKQMVRVVDGVPIDWSGADGLGNVDRLWREVGAKGRSQLQRLYVQLHVFDRLEQADFFENCVGLVHTG